jgi:TPR repeat protein
MSVAENGNAEAQCSLGELFKIGSTTGSANRAIESAGWSKAAEWFIKAAEQGNSEAQYQLGQLYSVELSDDNALLNDAEKWFKKAAEQGHVDAQGSLDKNKTVFNLTSIEEQEVRGRHDSRRNETPTTTNRSML